MPGDQGIGEAEQALAAVDVRGGEKAAQMRRDLGEGAGLYSRLASPGRLASSTEPGMGFTRIGPSSSKARQRVSRYSGSISRGSSLR